MARRTPRQEATHEMTLTPLQERCEECDQLLWVANHGHRTVTRLDGLWKLTIVVRQCIEPNCPRFHKRYRPEEEGRWALPHGEFGLLRHEVVSVAVGTNTGPNPMFCHWYSTRTCTGSNPRVGSFWDNVASFERMTVKL